MSDLTEFLLARIAEDEEQANRSKADLAMNPNLSIPASWVNGVADRVLAECEAKRRIVEREHIECAGHPGAYWPHGDYGVGFCGRADEQNATLLDLASVYAGHPDYQQEWKP